MDILYCSTLGPVSIWRPSFPGMGILMLKKRRSWDRLIFNMGILILARRHICIGTGPGRGGIVFTEYTNRKQPLGLGLRSFIIRKHVRPLKCQSQSKITARRFSYFPFKHFDHAIGSIVSELELVQLHLELTNTKGKTYCISIEYEYGLSHWFYSLQLRIRFISQTTNI